MADSNIGGSEGYENEELGIEDDPTEYSMDELFENCPPDQQTTDREQTLHQGFDPRAGPNGCLPEPWPNQGLDQAAASTQRWIAQQISGRSPGIFTENPSSQIPDSVLKKREYDANYRERQREYKKGLEVENKRLERENERLECEKQKLEEQMKSVEAENGRLKAEKHELEGQKKSFEGENGRLKREIQVKEQEMKVNVPRDEFDSFRRHNAVELARLRNEVDALKLKQQYQRTKRKGGMSPTEGVWTQSEEEDSFNSAKFFRIIRPSQMLANKRKAASSDQLKRKFLTTNMKRLRAEMQEISEEQQRIRKGKKQVSEKLEAIEAERPQLREDIELKLSLMHKIHKAREEGNFDEATWLTQLLRAIVSRENEQRPGSK